MDKIVLKAQKLLIQRSVMTEDNYRTKQIFGHINLAEISGIYFMKEKRK